MSCYSIVKELFVLHATFTHTHSYTGGRDDQIKFQIEWSGIGDRSVDEAQTLQHWLLVYFITLTHIKIAFGGQLFPAIMNKWKEKEKRRDQKWFKYKHK